MSLSASRMVLRQPRIIFQRTAVRNASTTSEAANAVSSTATKAKESASQATSKASEGLSRVTSSAGSGLSKVTTAATNTVSSIGGRTGRLINYVQCPYSQVAILQSFDMDVNSRVEKYTACDSLIPPTIYYSRVGLELAKLVFQGQKMSVPSMSHFQSYTQPIMHAVRNPGSLFNQTANATGSPTSMLSRLRNFDSQQMISTGVVAAEVIGFFTVGEMIGRRKIIGYNSREPAPEAQVHH
ncbi:ATP synthase subunit G atp20 [Elasticomyces elasticus]|nr:ATP synthase subunit G atp20 [Elasticomyces elasticus]